MSRLTVILPTYNERDNLLPLLGRIQTVLKALPVEWDVLVVDDNSPDGTAQTAEELSGAFPVRVLVREGRRGLARSVLDGFRLAEGEFFLVMDADLSHPPERISAMWEVMRRNDCDLVVGSRYVSGGKIENWPILRKLTSRASKLLVAPLTSVKDPLSGFFLVRRDAVERRSFDPRGFKILLEILTKGGVRKVREIPITFQDRMHGSSGLSRRVIVDYLLQVIKLYGERVRQGHGSRE
jgi:dolichol-phosphate mannosyltransferase